MARRWENQKQWQPEDDALLGWLWREGESAGRIARLFKRTRNSISGRVRRLALTRNPIKSSYADELRAKRIDPASRKKVEPSPTYVLAAALREDGEAYSDIIQETGLTLQQAYNAVCASRKREQRERRELLAQSSYGFAR